MKFVFSVLLGVIATIVFVGLLFRLNMWGMICLYWGVLTVKNWIDFVKES